MFLGACAGPASRVDLNDVEPIVPVVTGPAPPQTAGSLWTESRGGMFVDMKGKTVGDIITVVIIESASASKEATTETDRSSSMSAGISNILDWKNTSVTWATALLTPLHWLMPQQPMILVAGKN